MTNTRTVGGVVGGRLRSGWSIWLDIGSPSRSEWSTGYLTLALHISTCGSGTEVAWLIYLVTWSFLGHKHAMRSLIGRFIAVNLPRA